MLVLSRRPDEKLSFPDLGVTVTLLSVRGNVVKVGIDAPPEIRVARTEISESKGNAHGPATIHVLSRDEFHALKNELNAVSLCLNLYRRLRDSGLDVQAEATFEKLEEQFRSFQTNFAKSKNDVNPQAATPRSAVKCSTLLVEDDLNERELLAGILRLSGYEVATASDGQEAIEYLETHSMPDLVLLDMRMPRLDGRQTIESIRSNPKWASLKVFAVSGTAPSSFGVSTGPNGVDGWFDKPVDPEVLIRAIKRSAEANMSA